MILDRVVIALDAMGGDNAPDSVLGGADLFAKNNDNIAFLLFGDQTILNNKIDKYPALKNICQIYHSQDVIDDKEKPSNAVRKGRHSSMFMAIDAVRNNLAHAIISGGNTGALMAMAKLVMRTLPGIDRPAICSTFPTRKSSCVLLDLGANIDCNSDNLVQFALMGDAFAKVALKIKEPKIGLLNVGSEDNKGSETVKAAASELKDGAYALNFYGYVEGHDIAAGTVDVVVTDGFTGNIALKSAEGTARICADYIKQAFSSSPWAMLGGLLAKRALKRAFQRMDPRLHNGAMFVGLNGITVKSHGGTDALGFCNAINVAYNLARDNINGKISAEISAYNGNSIIANETQNYNNESLDYNDGQ